MTLHFPHEYTVDLEGLSPSSVSAGGRPALVGGAPPQFGGDASWWSPEHLLVASAALCLAATFHALAARARLEIRGYRTAATGTLDRADGVIRFTRVTLAVELDVRAEDRARAEALLQKAKGHCIVSNSLAVPVHLQVHAGATA
jgi:organic hydroperoxide reductase OsmC/OhrA